MPWEYSDKVLQLFMDAVQGDVGSHLGEIKDADGVGENGSIVCGDALRFTFRVEKNEADPTKDVIVQAKYQTFGCTSAIAASEALCMMIEKSGKTPIEALQITNHDLVDFLGGLPEQKIHCSVMGAEALEAAVVDWAQKRGVDLAAQGIELDREEKEEGRVVCKCFSVTEPYLKRKIRELNLKTIPEITNALKAGGACTACHHCPAGLQDMLDEVWKGTPHKEPVPDTDVKEDLLLSPYKLGKAIDRVVEQEIRPMLQKDGGDIDVVDIKEHTIYCQLQGACAKCQGAALTLKMMVEKTIKDRIDERLRVIAV